MLYRGNHGHGRERASHGFVLIITGAVLFMASDLVIGLERFVIPPDQTRLRATSGPVIWLLYFAAQTAFLFAFV